MCLCGGGPWRYHTRLDRGHDRPENIVTATRRIAELPGPRGLPLLGNLHQLWRIERSHLVAEEWAERYGPIVKFHVGRRLSL